jgi:hypothetical protein
MPANRASSWFERRSLRRAAGSVAFASVLLAQSGCATNRVLDANWDPVLRCSLGCPVQTSFGGDEAAIALAITAAPYVVLASTVTVALALDVITAPYQMCDGRWREEVRRLRARLRGYAS